MYLMPNSFSDTNLEISAPLVEVSHWVGRFALTSWLTLLFYFNYFISKLVFTVTIICFWIEEVS